MLLLNIIISIVFIAASFTVFYSLIYAIAGHFYKEKNYDNKDQYKKIAVFMPAYKEDEVIIQTARQALFQNYPSSYYDVIVIADSLQEETLQYLKQLPINVIEVKFDVSSKSKALNKAFEKITKQYDIAVILDADNVMKVDFLDKINAAFVSGCYAIQGHRTAKNTNTNFAILDAISEEINNHIMRKGQIALGMSSSVIGSGMAFSYQYLKQTMSEINAIGGFDKELELTLIEDKHKIVYLESAIVLDEKVQKSEVFANQRTRWISAQFVYLKKYWLKGLYNLLTGKFDYANKVAHYALVPKILLMGLLGIMSLISLVADNNNLVAKHNWILITSLYFIAFIISIPKSFLNKTTLKAIGTLPITFILMFKAMFKVKGANKKFIHTPHSANFDNKKAA